tara:strand:- start:3842 stop:5239 length:1398 start_codon:yes stop_codon:yes gene_type:complete
MSFKRYVAIADNSITNAYEVDGTTRATDSNTGEADVLEVFANYGDIVSGSMELSRILVKFDIDNIKQNITDEIIPNSGVTWYLKMFNTEHKLTNPKNFTINVHKISASWEEGYGVDLDNHEDRVTKFGSSWTRSDPSTEWVLEGGDYMSASVDGYFTTGLENLEIDVTTAVEEHIAAPETNHGFILKFPEAIESGSVSYYTKRFFARSSEFFYKRPVLEARWDASIKDDRGSFYASSSLAPASDNLNSLYLYNRIRGSLKDIPAVGSGSIEVSLYDMAGGTQLGDTFTGSHVSTGVYKCNVYADTGRTSIIDVWSSGSVHYHTGAITVKSFPDAELTNKYILKISNAKNYYSNVGTQRFRLYTRPKNWSPNIFTVAKDTPETTIIPSASIEISRVIDGEMIVPHGTGSTQHTIMSHDVAGNYFDLDMTLFEPGYDYAMTFAFYNDDVKTWQDQGYKFRFKVREDE